MCLYTSLYSGSTCSLKNERKKFMWNGAQKSFVKESTFTQMREHMIEREDIRLHPRLPVGYRDGDVRQDVINQDEQNQ